MFQFVVVDNIDFQSLHIVAKLELNQIKITEHTPLIIDTNMFTRLLNNIW